MFSGAGMSLELKNIEKRLGNFKLDGVSFKLDRGKTLGIVGSSGSGKTTVFKILMRFLSPDRGNYLIEGKNALFLKRKEFSRIVQGVFQNPSRTLDPKKSVRFLLSEPFLIHREIEGSPEQLLREVSLPQEVLDAYPQQLSGGQLQRIALARALALSPVYLIADEPTSALDPTVQVQILKLLQRLQAKRNMGMVFISHDINQVVFLSDQLLVMLSGMVMETGDVESVLRKPSPFTSYLVSPSPLPEREKGACPFYSKCPLAGEKCKSQKPVLRRVGDNHWVRCHYY